MWEGDRHGAYVREKGGCSEDEGEKEGVSGCSGPAALRTQLRQHHNTSTLFLG